MYHKEWHIKNDTGSAKYCSALLSWAYYAAGYECLQDRLGCGACCWALLSCVLQPVVHQASCGGTLLMTPAGSPEDSCALLVCAVLWLQLNGKALTELYGLYVAWRSLC